MNVICEKNIFVFNSVKVKLSRNKSCRFREGMECWASILTLTFDTAISSRRRSHFTPKEVPWYSFLLEAGWTQRATECGLKD
jgi:hypothetical protein